MQTIKSIATLVCLSGVFVSCSNDDRSDFYTLYRNSPLDHTLRLHWATFDANDEGGYNMNNCRMAARLLNANVIMSAKLEGKAPYTNVGFWCEIGSYKEEGTVPTNFPDAFPTDA